MEGALVGVLGALIGGVVAYVALDAVLAVSRAALPSHAAAALDWRVLGFAAAVAVGAGLLAALGPALRIGRAPASGTRNTQSRTVRQLLDALMASEIALACALAIGALLLLRTLSGLAEVELGFHPQGVLGAELVLPDSRYGAIDAQSLAVERTVQALAAQPGIASAAFVVGPPLRPDCCIGHNVVIEGKDYPASQQPGARVRPVLGDYFGALGIALLEGRALQATDVRGGERVAVVNHRFAQLHFPGQSAVGKRIAWRPGDVTPLEEGAKWMTIVGVVDDVKSGSLREEDSSAVYFPYLQRDQEWIRFGTLLARTPGDPMQSADAMARALASVDPLVPLQEVRSLQSRADEAVAPERFAAGLATAFGVLALALALQGVSAVLGFGVAQRRAELGIRAALGADASRLRRLLLGQGLRATVAGLGLGIAIALASSRALDALVFGVSARDGGSYLAVVASLALFALLAAWWPARRAARVAPAEALRHE
jgi:predicted permease